MAEIENILDNGAIMAALKIIHPNVDTKKRCCDVCSNEKFNEHTGGYLFFYNMEDKKEREKKFQLQLEKITKLNDKAEKNGKLLIPIPKLPMLKFDGVFVCGSCDLICTLHKFQFKPYDQKKDNGEEKNKEIHPNIIKYCAEILKEDTLGHTVITNNPKYTFGKFIELNIHKTKYTLSIDM